jgi:DNA-binding NtrC family response regulator
MAMIDPSQVTIMIVDDEEVVRDSLGKWFAADGYNVQTFADGKSALHYLSQATPDIIFLDIKMPGMDGIEVQKRIVEVNPDPTIIFMTAYASVETAVQALKQGAFDYVIKPIDPDDIDHLVRNAIEKRRLEKENVSLRRTIESMASAPEIIGSSAAMKHVMELATNVAPSDTTVLIYGESGTGKELIAQAIHQLSPRKLCPFIPVNCGALTESLLESELFGHEKGSFTGAQQRHKGVFEMADGGTLFLDEIGNISLPTQMRLLRVLETKRFTRLGGEKQIEADFRVICATNRNLKSAVEERTFREDLYYRINVFSITIPPLRERREDIPMLANHFLTKYSYNLKKGIHEISRPAMDRLVRYSWPGNVRELENAIERAVVVGLGPRIEVKDLPVGLEDENAPTIESLEEAERKQIQLVLKRAGGNISKAAKILGINRSTLYNKINKYNLKP